MSLRANSLSFSFSTHRGLLSGLSLSLADGAKVALTGPNGSGKTTLLRLLAGRLNPDEGHVSQAKDILLLEQHLDASGEAASGGERRIAALREAFASGARVLLLDEPTNDLDEDARSWLRESIRDSSSALLLVSHDPMILDCVDEIWELCHGKIVKHPSGYREFVRRMEDEESRLRSEIDSLRSESKKMDARARELIEAQQKRMVRGEKNGAKSNLPKILRGAKKRQAQATLAKLQDVQGERREELSGRIRQARERLRSLSMFEWDSGATRPPAGKRLIEVRDALLPGMRRGLSFEMTGPQRIRLKGKNGSGKSTLLRALCGDPDARARVDGDLHAARPFQLFDQTLSQYGSDEALWKWFQERTLLEVSLARSVLGRLGFEQEDQLRPVSALSGGERVRLEIALALHSQDAPQLLLLDEPTNHLDLESRRILQSFIDGFEGGMIVVSHDSTWVSSLDFDTEIDLDEFGEA